MHEYTKEQIENFEKILHTNPIGLKTQQKAGKDPKPDTTATLVRGRGGAQLGAGSSSKNLLFCKLNQDSGSINSSAERLSPHSLLQQTMSN